MTATNSFRSTILLASVALAYGLFSTQPARAAWVSYHDIAGTSHTAIPNTTSQSVTNAATPLLQFADGNPTGVTVTTVAGGWSGAGPTATLAPAAGTLADALFASSGLDLANGLISSRFDTQGVMTFSFSGLDPSKMYSVALYGHRNFAADGLDRFTLSGVDAAINLSSGTRSGLQAEFDTRLITASPGDAAYFTRINPGADGQMLLTASGVSGTNIVYFNGLRLQEMQPLTGTVLYRETFGNDSGTDQGLGYAGWVGYYGSSATLLPDTGTLRGDITAIAGASTSSGPINSDPNNNEPDNGVTATGFGRLLLPPGGGVSPGLVYTDEFTIDRSAYSIEAFRWDQASVGGAQSFQVALEIDGNWYVSYETFIGPSNGGSGTFGANAGERVLYFESAIWRSLAFTPGAALGTPGSFVTLPGGDITAFGLYGSFNQTMWFDTFTIEATALTIVPEPSQFSLAAVGLLGVVVLLRRRRRS